MAHIPTALMLLLNLLAYTNYSYAMMQEVHMTDEPDIEMGIVVTTSTQAAHQLPTQPLVIEHPKPATARCITKHVFLNAVMAACTAGIVLTKDIPFVPILIGLGDATILALKLHQMYQDAKNIPGHKALHSQISARLQEQLTPQALAMHKRTIPFEVIESFDYALSTQHKDHLTVLLYDTRILPTPPTVTKAELMYRKKKFFTLVHALKVHNILLPRDIKLILFAHAPELIYQKKLFQLTLPYANESNFIEMTTTCPIKWFNWQYHAISNAGTQEAFAETTATIMAETEMQLKLHLIASSGKNIEQPINQEAITGYLHKNYKDAITAPLKKK